MHHWKPMLQIFLMKRIRTYRKSLHITQEMMAELLRISPRSYISLEHGDNGCSATTLMFFLLILTEEDLIRLREDFRTLVEQEDSHVVA
ncbi:MAG: helix-turn-helix transcriptional regulator [Oscillospiraceae bacterium]|nr:helix-turn-helix transcriptional regulator [Oscillospiraceae bacterium]